MSIPNHAITLGYRIEAIPPNMKRADAIRAMIDALQNGTGALPDGLRVSWRIREGTPQDFSEIVRNGNPGLRNLMGRRLLRDWREAV